MVENLDVFNDYINKNNTKKNLLDRILDVLRAIRDFFFNAKVEELRSLNEAIGSLEKLIAESQAVQSKIIENTSTAEQTSQSEAQQSEARYSLSEDQTNTTNEAMKANGEVAEDRQGNPIYANGSLILEELSSIDDINDGDFIEPTRNIMLPTLPGNVQEALGANGKRVIINKNIFERNAIRHSDITPEQSKEILKAALYSPDLYGQNQKSKKPYNWVVISVKSNDGANKLVLLEINNSKEYIEVVHWHYVDNRGIEKIKRQAEREDGQLLILPPEGLGEVGALSDPTLSMPSESKDTTSSPNMQEERVKFSLQEPIFYSNAEYAVRGIKQEKATPEQWLKMIEKNGGLKAGEDKWLGLSDWLKASDKKTLTKDEVLQYIAENDIQIQEVIYGDVADISREEIYDSDEFAALRESLTEYDDDDNPYINREHYEELRSESYDFVDGFTLDYWGEDIEVDSPAAAASYLGLTKADKEINETRLQYTTGGLTNKKEIALVVPTIEPWNTSDNIHFGDAGEGRAVAWIRFGEAEAPRSEEVVRRVDEFDAPYKDVNGHDIYKAKDRLYKKDFISYGKLKSGEYAYVVYIDDKQIPVAHKSLEDARDAMNEYYKAHPAKRTRWDRVLVIDEIQSKRHQEGREKGYISGDIKAGRAAAKARLREAYDAAQDYTETLKDKYNWGSIEANSFSERVQKFNALLTAEEIAERKRLDDEKRRADEEWEQYDREIGAVPSAPFEKNWAELAMKRMLRYAAENGFDKVAWTTGDQQAERYGMLRAVSKIVRRDNSLVEGKRFLLVGNTVVPHKITVSDEGIIVASTIEYIEGKPLSEVMGKEVALKMMQMENDTYLEDADLKIGGSGMKAFYDQMLPSFVRKYAKKWGATVGEVTMPDLEENNTMHSVDVTPAMRESVMQGQPKFSLRDAETEKIFATAKEKFGTTYDMREAGYILPDGSMLDFSGKHQVRGTDTSFLNGNRTVDHREIADVAYDFDENETGVKTDMGDFLDRGAIRIDSNAGAINLNVAPTKAQKDRLKRLIERNEGYVYIDFGKGWDTEHYAEYEAARASRVLGDIDRYFDEGIKPTGNVRFSLREVNDRFNEELATLTEENARERILNVGTPSPILLACGIEDKPIRLYGAKLLSKVRKHGYKIDDLKNLPLAISSPIAVFEGSKENSFAILTELRIGNNNVLAALSVGKGGHDVDFNIISSVYDKQEDSVARWVNDGKMLWVDKKKALDYFSVSAPIAEAQNNQELISTTKVIQNFENPKIEPRFNLRDMPFFDDGGTNEDTAPQRGIITTKEQVKIYLRHKHLKAQQEIRKKFKMYRTSALLDYNAKKAARLAGIRSMRGKYADFRRTFHTFVTQIVQIYKNQSIAPILCTIFDQ